MAFLRKWGGGGGGNSNNPAVLSPPSVEVTAKREWHSETPGERYFGMENFGNTCYANSVLQSLYFSKPFRELIEAYQPAHAPPPSSPSLSSTTSQTASSSGPRPSPIPFNRRPNTTGAGPLPPASGSSLGRKPSIKPSNAGGRLLSNAFGDRRQSSASHAEDATPPTPDAATGGSTEGGAPLSTSSSFSGVGTPIISPAGMLGVDGPQPETTLLTTLHDLFVAISSQSKTTGTVAPQAFINQLKRDNEFFRSTLHQDAHEFLNYLVNMVAEAVEKEEKLKAAKAGTELPNPFATDSPKTWVHRLFEGILTNETRCLTCETVTSRDEAFLDLSIDIEPNSSVTACLRQFSASEMLCQRNKFSCDKCCGLQEAEKRMKIKKLPNILALHLKRFKYEESLQRHVKLTYRVVFPFELRLFNTADGVSNPDRLYELWAIVVHIGVGPHHGHYITVVKSGARWVVFDDNSVYPIEESDIQKFFGDTPGQGSGYVLFYQAVDLDLRGLGLQVPRDLPETASSFASTAPPNPLDETTSFIPILSSGLGLTLNDGAENVELPTSPSADAAHSFYPGASEPPIPHPIVLTPALVHPVPSSTTPTPSSHSSLPTTTPKAQAAVLPTIPPPVGSRSPKNEEKEGGWTLRGKKSMTSRIGRSLSLGPGKEAAGRSASSPLPATAEAPLPLPPPVSNGYTSNGDSPASASHPPLPPPDRPPLHPIDTLPASRHPADPSFSESPVSTPIFPPPASDDGSVSSLSTSHNGLPPPHHSPRRRGSRASIDLSSSGNAISNLFHRKTRPSGGSSSGNATPALAQPAVGLGLSRPANGTTPISSGVGTESFGHGAPLVSAQSTGPTRKEVERKAKEERKAREKEEERRVKERQRFVKEEARRVKEEAEMARKAEKVKRKMSVRMS